MLVASTVKLNPPIQYSIIWLLIGLGILLLIGAWFGAVFFMTRRKQLTTLATIGPGQVVLDLEGLKLKYLQLIDECYLSYQQGQTNLRGLHRRLSMTVRYFVYEARQFPAPRLTLADLARGPYPALTQVIALYYLNEFDVIEHGDPAQSVEVAKDMVRRWV